MKFGKPGQITLVSAIALMVATLFTACGTLNVGFLFVATNKQAPGQIEVYEVNSESGALRTIPTSPFPSGGRNPVAEVVSPDFKNLYVANRDDNNIVQFGIGTDGKLYPQSTINTPGSFPIALTINSANKVVYVLDTLQRVGACSLTNPCPGVLASCNVNANGSLGTLADGTYQCLNSAALQLKPTDAKTVLTPTSLDLLANGSFAYVSAYNSDTNVGYVFAFATGADGTLTPLNGGLPYSVGSQPVAMASDDAGATLYVADKQLNKISIFGIQSDGTLALQSSAATGDQPSALTLDGSKFLYVTNSGDSNVTGYAVGAGSLSKLTTSASDTNPIAITVDPKKLGFLYTVNFLGNSLSGFQINPNTGALINTQNTPYASSVQPTAIAGIPHGGTTKAK